MSTPRSRSPFRLSGAYRGASRYEGRCHGNESEDRSCAVSPVRARREPASVPAVCYAERWRLSPQRCAHTPPDRHGSRRHTHPYSQRPGVRDTPPPPHWEPASTAEKHYGRIGPSQHGYIGALGGDDRNWEWYARIGTEQPCVPVIVEHGHGLCRNDVRHMYERDRHKDRQNVTHRDSSIHLRGSVTPTEHRHLEMTWNFLESLGVDANGDLDLRRASPSCPAAAQRQQRVRSAREPKAHRPGFQASRSTSSTKAVRESLTIKVDMNRPPMPHSLYSGSSEEQLSLDLISVGRRRLDFLSTHTPCGLEGSASVHAGTFAQEIITLVHQVTETICKGSKVTLNQRFSSCGTVGEDSEEEEEEQNPTAGPQINRRIDMSLSELRAHIFRQTGEKQRQAAIDPFDLRHDLERRRQERLEKVKITIPGASVPQRHRSSCVMVELNVQESWLQDHNQAMQDSRTPSSKATFVRNCLSSQNQRI